MTLRRDGGLRQVVAAGREGRRLKINMRARTRVHDRQPDRGEIFAASPRPTDLHSAAACSYLTCVKVLPDTPICGEVWEENEVQGESQVDTAQFGYNSTDTLMETPEK